MRGGLSLAGNRTLVNAAARPPDIPRPRRPMSRAERRVTFWLKTLGLIAVAIYLLVGFLQFLSAVKATAMLFVIALFFAYLVFPLVRRLNERLPLGISILLVYVAILIVGIAIAQLIIPALVADVQGAVKAVPGLVTHFGQILSDPNNKYIRWLPQEERIYLVALPTQIAGFLQTNASDTAVKTLNVLLSTVSILATVVVVPVLAAYMLLDAESLKANFLGLIPRKFHAKTESIIADLDQVVGGFIRGQLIDGSILGAMLTVMLLFMHVQYAFLIGFVSGALNFIPYAGALIAFIPAVLLALAYNGPVNALIVAALIVVIHQIDGNFVSPRVLKENVGLSPFWIVLAILVGSELFGLAGTFLAVPVAAMIRVLREQLLPRPVPVLATGPGLTQAPLADTHPPVVPGTAQAPEPLP
jgi:predicted PurR-regulated permease PerM